MQAVTNEMLCAGHEELSRDFIPGDLVDDERLARVYRAMASARPSPALATDHNGFTPAMEDALSRSMAFSETLDSWEAAKAAYLAIRQADPSFPSSPR